MESYNWLRIFRANFLVQMIVENCDEHNLLFSVENNSGRARVYIISCVDSFKDQEEDNAPRLSELDYEFVVEKG